LARLIAKQTKNQRNSSRVWSVLVTSKTLKKITRNDWLRVKMNLIMQFVYGHGIEGRGKHFLGDILYNFFIFFKCLIFYICFPLLSLYCLFVFRFTVLITLLVLSDFSCEHLVRWKKIHADHGNMQLTYAGSIYTLDNKSI
jgi:hypothetical protein